MIGRTAITAGGAVVHGPAHGQQGGLEDIEVLDFARVGTTHADAGSPPFEQGEQLLAPAGGEELGVLEHGVVTVRRQDHAGGDHRPGERPAAGLVDTGHAGAAAPVERPLETEGVVRVGRDSGRKGLAGGCGHHYRH